MACRGCWECLLKLLNFILTLAGLAMVGYGIYLFVEFSKAEDDDTPAISPVSDDPALIQLARPMLMAVPLSNSFFDKLPGAWFICLFIGIGVVLFVISCFGCIGVATRNGCCLSCYSFLVVLLILVELGCAAFIFFDKNWKEEIPTDKTADFDMIYGFLRENWNIVKWVALGIAIFEVRKLYDWHQKESHIVLQSCVCLCACYPQIIGSRIIIKLSIL
ncbi:Tobamovirus multiplication protein 2A [Spatholobus suberectus]|nr:Tobamovirus multiplication protein 2A [Spatholobus suberectus]